MIKNKIIFISEGILFLILVLLNLAIGFKDGFDYHTLFMVTLMLMFGLSGVIKSMRDEEDNKIENQRKVNSAIDFKAANVTIYVIKFSLLVFFTVVYVLRGTTWLDDVFVSCGMFGMIVLNIIVLSEFFAKIYYIRKVNR